MDEEYLLSANIERYRLLLSSEADAARRTTIKELLADAERKLGGLLAQAAQRGVRAENRPTQSGHHGGD